MNGMDFAAENEKQEVGISAHQENEIENMAFLDDEVIDMADTADLGPVCREHPDCHAWEKGRCVALADTDFGTRGCPFYKNKEQNEWEQQDALERLLDKNRMDLIEKYRVPLVKLGILPDEDGTVTGSASGELEDPYIDQITAELEQYSEQCMDELLESGTPGATEESDAAWEDSGGDEEVWDD